MTTNPKIEQPYRTATETVMSALDRFTESEPKGVLIIHTDESGDLVITANIGKCFALGMIETAKHLILSGEV